MTGVIMPEQAIARSVAPEDLNRLYEAGAISVEMVGAPAILGDASGLVSADDLCATILARRKAISEEPIADCLTALRRELRDFVRVNNREPEGFGFGRSGGVPVDCSGILKRVSETVLKLEAIGEDKTSLSPLVVEQRRVIPQLTAVMEEFLVDMGSITTTGEADRSGVAPVLKACIHLSRVVGEVVQALSAMKLQMSMAGS